MEAMRCVMRLAAGEECGAVLPMGNDDGRGAERKAAIDAHFVEAHCAGVPPQGYEMAVHLVQPPDQSAPMEGMAVFQPVGYSGWMLAPESERVRLRTTPVLPVEPIMPPAEA